MNKGMFYGWKDVFAFSFKQATEQKYKKNTTIIAVVLLLIGIVACSVMAFIQKESDNKVYDMETVYVIDDSELATLYWDGFLEENKEKFPKISFELTQKDVKTLSGELGEKAPQNFILQIEKKEEGYLLTAMLPEGSAVKESDAEDLCDELMMAMEQSKLISSGIPMEKLVVAMSGVNSDMVDAGEQPKSVGQEVMESLMPMLITLAMFFIIYLNGMTIGNAVSIEKSSKLMEMMLTLTKPYALIVGKIAAVALSALLQVGIWIAALIGGFVGGHQIALKVIYADYHNLLFEVLDLMKNADGSRAFSVGAILLTLASIAIGFLFYCMVAGFFASFASKAEELGQVMSFFMMISMISFYVAYFVSFASDDGAILSEILRFIPFTSAFLLPADIIIGKASLAMGIVQLLILLAAGIVIGVIAGRMYKNQVFYRGKSLLERFKKKKATE